MDVMQRIHELREQRGWSVNYLAMEAGMTQSTLGSILSRGGIPKIETLTSLCNAFGITLAQFFLEEEETEVVTKQEKELLTTYRKLSPQKKKALIELLSEQ